MEVKFEAYRQYLDQRQSVNSAIMALLSGAHLSRHVLSLTEGSDSTLRQMFPAVPHIGRFNLKTSDARMILGDASKHLSAMSIPYVVAVQESLFSRFEDMLEKGAGNPLRKSGERMKSPVWVVKEHWESLGLTLDLGSWELFGVINEVRHDLIHRFGTVGPKTARRAANMSYGARSVWSRMSRNQFPAMIEGASHRLDHELMIVVLAVVKFLAKEGNEHMQSCYPREMWLADLVDEAVAARPLQGNPQQQARTILSYGRLRNFGIFKFSLDEITAVLERS